MERDDVRAAARSVAAVLDGDHRCARCDCDALHGRWVWLPHAPIWCCEPCAVEGEAWLERRRVQERAARAAEILRGYELAAGGER